MAKVGDILPQPEIGWRRYDDNYVNILYSNLYHRFDLSSCYGGTCTCISNASHDKTNINFKFIGTKIRLICVTYVDSSNIVDISIDGVVEQFSTRENVNNISKIVYEKLNLYNKIHNVEISINKNSVVHFFLDCIDIDENGYMIDLIETKLNKKSTLESMEIGDIIPCKYTAPISGKVGYFSELGICNYEGIDVDTSSDTPDGKFYFVKVDDNKFIADRNVQSSISWNELNKSRLTCKMLSPNSLVFNGRLSYVSIPIAKLKPTKEITIKIKLNKDDWTVGQDNDTIFSCTEAGGYSCYYMPKNKYFEVWISLTGVTPLYFKCGFNVDLSNNGWKTFYISLNGEEVKLYDGLTLKCNEKQKGTIVYGNTSHLVLGGEPGQGFSVSTSEHLNGKISEFAIWDKAIDPLTIDDNLTGNEENLICLLKSTNAIGDRLYDLSANKNTATIKNCVKEYDYINDYYYTVPNGGIAYNDDITISFPKKALKSNEDDNYILEQSSVYGSCFAYLAFNKSNSNESDCWHSNIDFNPYIIVSSKKDKIISKGFRLTNRNCPNTIMPPSTCIVYGSNDNESFEKIYETQNLPSTNKATSYHYFSSQVEYLHYKFSFTGLNSYIAIGQIEIFKEYEYKDSSSSLINKKQGGWPIENDWDKHIRNSDLKENIIAGDNEIWNYHNIASLCKEKVITDLKDINNENIESTNGNILIPVRGKTEDIDDLSAKMFNICLSSVVAKNIGFRPMLIIEGVE
ncbi:TPA: hypothetical protein KOS81_003980 [Clostridioides difficile]|uniref:LamG-like jellyroll fold domain-containing protein n=1 Tax=Clostridioides difficile TaxID=1496 RepID=UPI001C158A1D|nr:hypothetical protein [Clostridioides difficile]HBF6276942.1 hypothetical protein [Clostridioides difficile]HBH3575227.1 hypothetical protein [Clostridioides difficile]HBY3545106.1 hypothetical protein [Clostridioides difficile]HBY3547472.1 hypothetical protein [Clostridioides difficile]